MAVRIWDPRWLTMCAVIRTVYITWLISVTLSTLGSSMWRVLACYFLGPSFTDWATDCYVPYGCIGSPEFSFPVDGGQEGGGCPLVLHSLLLISVFGSAASCLVLQVNQSHYRPGVVQRFPRSYGSQISWRHRMPVSLSALGTVRFYPQEMFLVLISIGGWVDPRTIVRLEGLCQWKNPMTPAGIEPAICSSAS